MIVQLRESLAKRQAALYNTLTNSRGVIPKGSRDLIEDLFTDLEVTYRELERVRSRLEKRETDAQTSS